MCELDKTLPIFKGIEASFENRATCSVWQKVFESTTPEEEAYPEPFSQKLTPFQKFFPIAALRPDRIIACTRIYIASVLG